MPGGNQLKMESPYIEAMGGGHTCNLYPTDHCFAGDSKVILTAANSPHIIANSSQFHGEKYASWAQVHEDLATMNWIALAEAKLTQEEANYVAQYGLAPWQSAIIVNVGMHYWDTPAHAPLITDLYPKAAASWVTGPINPVLSVSLLNAKGPWCDGLLLEMNSTMGNHMSMSFFKRYERKPGEGYTIQSNVIDQVQMWKYSPPVSNTDGSEIAGWSYLYVQCAFYNACSPGSTNSQQMRRLNQQLQPYGASPK